MSAHGERVCELGGGVVARAHGLAAAEVPYAAVDASSPRALGLSDVRKRAAVVGIEGEGAGEGRLVAPVRIDHRPCGDGHSDDIQAHSNLLGPPLF